jgi:hypothetical protein
MNCQSYIAPICTARLTDTECTAFRVLRIRYQTSEHIFTDRELRLLRWLVHGPGWDRAMDRLDEASGVDEGEQETAARTRGLLAS